jgi:hypothetical protein
MPPNRPIIEHTPFPKKQPKTPRPRFHSFFFKYIYLFLNLSVSWVGPERGRGTARPHHIYRVGNGAGRGALLNRYWTERGTADVSGVLSEIEASQSA